MRNLATRATAASFLTALLLAPGVATDQAEEVRLTAETAARFAQLALDCVHREYPNKIAHVLQSDSDVLPPRELTPAFHGCFDWHSAVHGHWLLARLSRLFPEADFVPAARAALQSSLTPAHIAAEVRYFEGDGRATFERPYGLAWLLQLSSELRDWDDEEARQWSENLEPLEHAVVARLDAWLPKLAYPIREGEHNQTAFAFGLILDWAAAAGDSAMLRLMRERVRTLYLSDRDCPLEYEPSGQDFLSPCLGEADLLRRVLSPGEFATWLDGFLPRIPTEGRSAWLVPGLVTDPTDGKLVHLDGLNLSRAWMLEGIVSGLPPGDPRREVLRRTARLHAKSGLAAITGEHYEGGHWLASFAVYLLTQRGLPAGSE